MAKNFLNIDTLNGVEKTLIIPLWARSEETKNNGLIKDYLSIELIEQIDIRKLDLENMNKFIRNYLLTAIANRTILIDNFLNRILDSESVVVNLGCGLDTRHIRYIETVKHWFDVDLDNVISLRRKLVDEKDNYSMLVGSLFDEELFDKIGHKKIVCICEGLLMYFKEEEVKQFLNNLVSSTSSGKLIVETLGAWTKLGVNPVIKNIGENSRYIWTINNPDKLNNLDGRLEYITSNSIFDININRWNQVGKLMKFEFLKNRISSNISIFRYECQ